MSKDRFLLNLKPPRDFVWAILEKIENSHDGKGNATKILWYRRKDVPEPEKKYEDGLAGTFFKKETKEMEEFIKKCTVLEHIEVYEHEMKPLSRGKFHKEIDIIVIEEPENVVSSTISTFKFYDDVVVENENLKAQIEILKEKNMSTIMSRAEMSDGVIDESKKKQLEDQMIFNKKVEMLQNPQNKLPEKENDNFLSSNNNNSEG